MLDFIFPNRLHRLAYFLRGIVADTLISLFLYMTTEYSGLWSIAAAGLYIYGTFFIVLPRIRDLGMSGWWLLLNFVPVANAVFGIILLFRAPMYSPRATNSLPPVIPATS